MSSVSFCDNSSDQRAFSENCFSYQRIKILFRKTFKETGTFRADTTDGCSLIGRIQRNEHRNVSVIYVRCIHQTRSMEQ